MNTTSYKDQQKAFADKCAREEAFYTKCGEILNIEHIYIAPVPRRTRWNNRLLGNGRYKGFGLIRCMGPVIMVTSRKAGTKTFESYEDVYKYLEAL